MRQRKGYCALNFYQVDGDLLFGVGGKGKVDSLVAFTEGVLLTEALREVEGGDLGVVLWFGGVVSGVGWGGVAVWGLVFGGITSSLVSFSRVAIRRITLFCLISSLHYHTKRNIRSLIGKNGQIKLLPQLILLKRQRIKQRQVYILLRTDIRKLHIFILLIGGAHDCCIPTDNRHEEHDLLDFGDVIGELELVVVVGLSVEEVFVGVGLF